MTPVLPNEILAVTDHPSVVHLISVPLTCVKGLPSVETPCSGIRIFCDGSVLIKGLRKAFSAYTILHARRVFILSTTGTMNHKLFDKLKQLRIVHRKLRRHKAVNLLWGTQLGMRLKEDNDMGMRKASLLELNGVKEARNISKDAIFDVMNEGVKLGMKHPCDQIRAHMSWLVIKKGITDFRPSRIGSHGDKKVSTSKIPVDGQGILTKLLHVTCASRERRGENGPPAQVIEIGIHIGNSICQALIKLNPKIVLNGSKSSKTLLLSNCPRLTDIGLKELASKKEMVGLSMKGANMEAIAKVFFQRDILSLVRGSLILYLPIRDSRVPSHLSSWKKKNITQ